VHDHRTAHVVLDTLNHRRVDPQHRTPYPDIAHAVLRTPRFLTFDKPET
jgi:hypothetical protein